jgi:hypothetical protein
VFALEEWDGGLLAGGIFSQNGGRAMHHLARWSGFRFEPFGNDPPGPVRAILPLSGGGLVVGGALEGTSKAYVARWDGVGWQRLGDEFTGFVAAQVTSVSALAEFRGEIVAAGGFVQVDGETVGSIARWDGTRWRSMEGGVRSASGPSTFGAVRDLAVHGGNLVAVGSFSVAGGVGASGIAEWDGSRWRAFQGAAETCDRSGTSFQSLAATGESLFVVGMFGRVGNVASSGIAEWISAEAADAPAPSTVQRTEDAEQAVGVGGKKGRGKARHDAIAARGPAPRRPEETAGDEEADRSQRRE